LKRRYWALLSDLIRKYYACIDGNDIDWVVSLFCEDAVYQRADSRYQGKESIARFFRQDRAIQGRHLVEALWSFDHQVICTGVFVGHGKVGDSRRVRFADFWYFNEAGLVLSRDTYLALGQEYIKA
jgi:nuclear transport factor 2 (NTF2) superfamily protein